jgi:hypothetical protein
MDLGANRRREMENALRVSEERAGVRVLERAVPRVDMLEVFQRGLVRFGGRENLR